MSTATDRATFRSTLAQAAEQARLLLPQAVNGRIESAVKLVLGHDVVFNSDGTATVGSSSDPMKTHTIAGATCDCQDFVHGKGTEGWCQHRIAANLQRSVERVLARQPEPEVILPEEMEVFPDNDAEEAPEPPTPVPTAPLPEAPVSITLKATLHGHEVLVTLRGVDFASVKAQVEQASQWLQAQTPTPAQPHTDAAPQCPTHGPLKPSTKGKGYYCPQKLQDGSWCKGR
jgi:hypothetical protein